MEPVMTINPEYTDASAEKPTISQASLTAMLRSMEARAKQAEYPDQRARILNLAGDLCFDAGERERALGYYGRAIDVNVAHHEYSAAVAICQKIVRLTPEVVRARCTLAWMAIARGLIHEAQTRVEDYKVAADHAGQARLARAHLLMMAEVIDNRDLLVTIAEALIELGDSENADRVYGAAFGCAYEHRMAGDAEERWRTVLRRITNERAN
jgi:tetratricopeptide (TPR) repeat protein